SLTITAYDVPSDATQAITPTNAGARSEERRVGNDQNMACTFAGTTDQRVTFGLVPSSGLGWQTTVYNPDGSILWGSACCGNTWVELLNMPQTRTYRVCRAPVCSPDGSLTITAYDVPSDATQAITPTNAGA